MADCSNTPTPESTANFDLDSRCFSEVMTSNADYTTAKASDGNVKKTFASALRDAGWEHVGEWSTNPLVTESNQVIPYAGTNQLFRPLSIPYQVDSATNPNPNALLPDPATGYAGELRDVSKFATDEDITEAQNEILGGSIFKGLNGETVEIGDSVPVGTTHLGVLISGEPIIVKMLPIASGEVTSLTETGAAIGGVDVEFIKIFNPDRIYFDGGKFSLGRSSAGTYFTLVNEQTGQTVFRFTDATSESDSNLFVTPLEVRNTGHTVLSTADTVGGSTDWVSRTMGFSDYFYMVWKSTYQQERMILSHDTKPSRPDGTRKDGTGGEGQLPPSDDVYAFDDSFVIPSNISGDRYDYSQHIRFPSLYALFEQGVGVRRRTRGNYGYQWNYGNSDNDTYIECLETGNNLLEYTPDSVVLSGCKYPSKNNIDYSTTPICAGYTVGSGFNPRVQYSHYDPSVGSTNPLNLKVVKSGIIKIVDVKLNVFTGTSNTGYWIGKLAFNGNSVTAIGTPDESLPANVTFSYTVDSDGDLLVTINYTGAGLRTAISFDIV